MLFYLFFLFTIIIDVKSVEREREMKRGAGMYQNISQSNHFCSFYTRINVIYLRPQAICLFAYKCKCFIELCHLYYVNLFENHNFSRMWILNL